MKLESYWLDTAPSFGGGEPGAVSGAFDVAVIGGGFTGLSAAQALAKQGASVVVFEAGRVVGEASGRNGGQCNSGLAHDFGALAARLGAPRARAYYQAYLDAVDSVEGLVRDEAIDCDFVRCGRLKLAAKPEHYDKLARSCERLIAEIDPDVELLSPEQAREEVASDAFYGGLLQKTSAKMHMGRFGVGLAEAAVRRGARVLEQAPVTGLRRMGNQAYQVTSARGTVTADQVLLATGSSSVGPLGYFRRRLVSVGSFIIVTEPLDADLLRRLLPNRRGYVTSKNIGNYFRTTADDRLVFGGRARFAMSNPRSDVKSGDILRDSLREIFPELGGARIDYCWGGLVDMTADRLPRAGQRKGLFYSLGYSGHGVQMSVHMGQAMARTMAGDADANPWRDLNWPPIPGHFGKPWFLPFVGAYYRLQDRLH